jgi:hypothetical protein
MGGEQRKKAEKKRRYHEKKKRAAAAAEAVREGTRKESAAGPNVSENNGRRGKGKSESPQNGPKELNKLAQLDEATSVSYCKTHRPTWIVWLAKELPVPVEPVAEGLANPRDPARCDHSFMSS